jgi:hypothetical protein
MMMTMMDREEPREDALDRALAGHLAAQLDGQRGRAAEAFRAALAAGVLRNGPDAAADPHGHVAPAMQIQRHAVRRTMWMWGGIPTALAACVAIAVGLQVFLAQPATRLAHNTGPNLQLAPAAMEENLWTRDVDGGMVVSDQGPMKVLKEQTVRQRRWVDPQDGAVYSLTEPGEKVGYVRVKPF